MDLRDRRVAVTGASGFIGTNLVHLLTGLGAVVANLDIKPPLDDLQSDLWVPCDVNHADDLTRALLAFEPEFIVHLAARTDMGGKQVADYSVNYIGTRNVSEAAGKCANVDRIVFTSTQYVLGPGRPFVSETEFGPHTVYGRSKVLAEQLIRAEPPRSAWTIVRPTNVWGPWHERYRDEFWRVLSLGLYVHPSRPDPIRSYGYVGSVCAQIVRILMADPGAVDEHVIYVGDEPVRLSQWVDAFSIAMRSRPARRMPLGAMVAAARCGDFAERCGIRAPSPAHACGR